jgi:2-keto-4-pentenoate hydratase/2-oxohepta-3-ene-1,7-dioic acid hydratase in catechol pathway
MKLVTFQLQTQIGQFNRIGALIDGDENGRIADLTSSYLAYLVQETGGPMAHEIAQLRMPPDMIGWLKGGERSFDAATQTVAFIKGLLDKDENPRGLENAQLVFNRSEVKLLAPVPRPHSIRDFTTYFQHMSQATPPIPRPPAWYRNPPYYKGNPDTVCGPEDPIPFPYYTERLDLEFELGIIIGKEGRNLSFDEARDHIAGYTIFVDSTCRDGNAREPFGPTKRKDFNSVLGPCLVTPDEIDEGNIDIKLSVDGETWYEGNTNLKRSFDPHHLVAYASDNETIYPGDVMGTGTIGLCCAVDLDKWIQVGQTATFEAAGLGTLVHEVVAGEHVVDHINGMDGLLQQPEEAGK